VAAYSAFPEGIRSRVRMVRKARMLPLPGEVLAEVGDVVEPSTPVARIALRPGIPWVIAVAGHLGIPPGELRSRMTKTVGDKVKAKENIAVVDRGLYGRKEYNSPVDGVIEDISEVTGRVTIREEFGKEEPPMAVDVASELGCKPQELPGNMLRKVGQEVKKGQMLAKKGEIQAFFTKTSLAPISGIISEVNTETGKVTISRPFKQVVVRAYLSGTVSEALPGKGCVVETPGIRLSGIFGTGKETHGVLRVLTKGPDEVLTPEMIGPDCLGKVIVGGSFATNESLAKAVETGVRAVVTGTVNYLNLTRSLGVKLGVGITGQEDVDMTVVLMEGFGQLAMRQEIWDVLKALEGFPASVNGATQIRAGAIRPEVIVPLPGYDGPIGEDAVIDEDLRVGMRVRAVSEPYFGLVGTIGEIVREPQAVETGARVSVVRVRLPDGRSVTVPRANVEVF
jgi:hypothetical protein